MDKPKYYDGTKLLSLKDLEGNTPEIFICTSNRSAGKTTYFQRLLVNRFLKHGEKFMVVYRFKYELQSVADKFFKDIQSLFFQDYTMKELKRASGSFIELFLVDADNQEHSCGYAVALSTVDSLKKYSHFFSDVGAMFFDEFQSETESYLPREVSKLMSLHTTTARGQGKQVRRVPVYMVSNPVSILNPYYDQLGITDRLQENTKFLKGIGWVMEQGHNESAAKAQSESAFNRAFKTNEYTQYQNQGKYLLDNKAFIERLQGKYTVVMTLIYHGQFYSVKRFDELGLVYIDDKGDENARTVISVTDEDHNINYVSIKSNYMWVAWLRQMFNLGVMRFKNQRCKDCFLTCTSQY